MSVLQAAGVGLVLDIADRADAFAIPGPGTYPEPCPERASDQTRHTPARKELETWYMLFVASHSPGLDPWFSGRFQGGGGGYSRYLEHLIKTHYITNLGDCGDDTSSLLSRSTRGTLPRRGRKLLENGGDQEATLNIS